jgi:hypothetical protein
MKIDQRHFRVLPGEGFELCGAVIVAGWWVRAGIFYGMAPGSHMAGKHFAYWPTSLGSFRGWNTRFGWWPKPCVTMLLHMQPERGAR